MIGVDIDLAPLGRHSRIAFAATCCESLLPHYRSFCRVENAGDIRPLLDAVNVAWEAAGGRRTVAATDKALYAAVLKATPDADDFGTILSTAAQEAGIAVAGTLRLVSDPSVEVTAAVAEAVVNCADMYAQAASTDQRFADLDPLLSGDLVAAERARQRSTVDELHGAAVVPEILRARLQSEARTSAIASIATVAEGFLRATGH